MFKRIEAGDTLINRRNGKQVSVISVTSDKDSQADWIITNDKGVYGCAIALEDEGWFRAVVAERWGCLASARSGD